MWILDDRGDTDKTGRLWIELLHDYVEDKWIDKTKKKNFSTENFVEESVENKKSSDKRTWGTHFETRRIAEGSSGGREGKVSKEKTKILSR